MIIGCPKETLTGEKRVAMTPESAKHLQKLGYDCIIQSGAGAEAGFADVAYDEAGVYRRKDARCSVQAGRHRGEDPRRL